MTLSVVLDPLQELFDDRLDLDLSHLRRIDQLFELLDQQRSTVGEKLCARERMVDSQATLEIPNCSPDSREADVMITANRREHVELDEIPEGEETTMRVVGLDDPFESAAAGLLRIGLAADPGTNGR